MRGRAKTAGRDAYVRTLRGAAAESLKESEEAMRAAVDDLRSAETTREVLAKLKGQKENALCVAYRIMSPEGVRADASIVVNVCHPLWTAHTERVRDKLTPANNFA